jgi:hypothetical protein
LQSLPTIMHTRFESIRTHLKGHQSDFTSFEVIGWRSKAKSAADEAVTMFTTHSTSSASDAETEIVNYIKSQLQALESADK